MFSRVQKIARDHPLATVLGLAVLIRIPAVIWSKGFIHSDDHFDTVMIAYDWIINGMWGPDGYMEWRAEPASQIGRFPLYVLLLWAVMKVYWAAGVRELAGMMYTIRLLHALVSLVPVWGIFVVVKRVTGEWQWAFWGAVAVAFHFAMPFLGVRNLIEMVGGSIWLGALALVYIYRDSEEDRWLVLAGIVSGLAWMIRFQMAFAIIPVPFLLWWEHRRFRAAVIYSIGVGVMLVVSGLVDLGLLGRFAGSTITNLTINAGLGAVYETVTGMYVGLLLLFLVPPVSFVLVWLMLRRSFWKRHVTLVGSSVAFVLFHSLHANQQERFLFPILPAFFLMAALALWRKYRDDGYILKRQGVWKGLVVGSLAINVVLLAILTPAYGHKGMVESALYIRERDPSATVLFLQPEVRSFYPRAYGGEAITGFWVRNWEWLEGIRQKTRPADFDYVVVFPGSGESVERYVDSAQTVVGSMAMERVIEPSFYDWLLYKMNPKHNQSYEAWIYRVE